MSRVRQNRFFACGQALANLIGAKESWEALAKRGLTSYSDQVERTLVFVRLMALGGIYLDFCELAFEEIHDAAYTMWASDLCLNTFRVAQCVGSQFSKDEEADDDQLLEDALRNLGGRTQEPNGPSTI